MSTKTVLITGSSSGIGLELVKIFLAKKWNVIATLRSPSNFPLTDKDNLLVLKLDVEKEELIKNAIEKGLAQFKTIDLVISNAGFGQFGIFEDMIEDNWKKQIGVNFFGALRITQQIIPIMRKQNGGRIVYISSIMGISSLPGASIYCASKYALDGFVECLTYELNQLGITLKLILPGAVKTRFWKNSKITLTNKESYSQLTKKLVSYKGGKSSTNPTIVAKRIYKISLSKRNKLRYYVTKDAKLVHLLKIFCTDTFRRKLIKIFYFYCN